MAKLEDVLPAFRSGKKIKRSLWDVEMVCQKDDPESCEVMAILAEDWEIVEEKPKTKTVWQWAFKNAHGTYFTSTRLADEKDAMDLISKNAFKISGPYEVPNE